MLENEQTTSPTDSTTEGTAAKKTARKRATKKTAASDTSTATPPTATKKTAARRSTAKKTAAPAEPGSPVPEQVGPPAKKTARRSTKRSAAPTESPFAAPEPASRATGSVRRGAAPAVLFQAPQPVVAARGADVDPTQSAGRTTRDAAGDPAAAAPATPGRRTRTRSASRPDAVPAQSTDPAQVATDSAPPSADAAADAPASTTRRTRTRSASRAAGAPGSAGEASAAETGAAADEEASESPRTRATRSRSRSASARDASADEMVPAETETGDARDESTSSSATGVDDAAEQPSPSSSRRRRRGSRGRGRKPATTDEDDGASAETTAATDDADQIRADEPAEPATSSRSRSRSRSGSTRADATTDDEPTDEPATGSDDSVAEGDDGGDQTADGETGASSSSSRRRRRRRRSSDTPPTPSPDDPPQTIVKVRDARPASDDVVTGVAGSTRLEAKKQRRRDGRDQARRRTPVLTEAEFLARREAVDRVMVVRQSAARTQIAVLEDGVLVEHYVTQSSQTSYVGNVYLGRVQNVLPAMEAAFIDIGKGRNGVLYAGEVAWSRLGLEGKPKRVESVLSSGSPVLVQVTKDPVAHKGARLTGMVTLPGRFLVYAPGGSMSGISRKLPENERNRLKSILKKVFPDEASVIIRTAAEGASEEELTRDVKQLEAQWNEIEAKLATATAPSQLYAEPDLAIKVVRDMFNEDVAGLVISGDEAWDTLHTYVSGVAPDLLDRVTRWEGDQDVFAAYRVDEQIAKALDRKVWLPSGGSLVIDRTEAMTVIDVNTGKFTGSGGSLEETVTKNNLEAAEEIVRQIRLRDVGGIIVIDFIDMVLERNRDLVLRRLVECLGRDRTRHQVAEVTSLGLVQMTRKRVGVGLFEAFSETCEHCQGRGVHVHAEPIEQKPRRDDDVGSNSRRDEPSTKKAKSSAGSGKGSKKGKSGDASPPPLPDPIDGRKANEVIKAIAAAASRAHANNGDRPTEGETPAIAAAAGGAEVVADVDSGRDDADVVAIEISHVGVDTEASLVGEDVTPTDLSQLDLPEAAPPAASGRPKRGRVTRPAGAPA